MAGHSGPGSWVTQKKRSDDRHKLEISGEKGKGCGRRGTRSRKVYMDNKVIERQEIAVEDR